MARWRRRGGTALVRDRRGRHGATITAVAIVVLFGAAVGFGVIRAARPGDYAVPSGATATGVPVGRPDAPATVVRPSVRPEVVRAGTVTIDR